uniref:acylphosphatase n=1 Tax=Chenopodium quinoa TaxID=63459 RepID=A0A803N4N3_CHEQI
MVVLLGSPAALSLFLFGAAATFFVLLLGWLLLLGWELLKLKLEEIWKGRKQVLEEHRFGFQESQRSYRRQEDHFGLSNLISEFKLNLWFMTASQLANPDSKRRPLRWKPAAQRRSVNKVQEKKKPIPQRRKVNLFNIAWNDLVLVLQGRTLVTYPGMYQVDSSQKETQKARKDCCKTALDLASHDENLCSFPTKADDEELELRELQAGPNPLTCGAHFANGGKTGNYGCSLCKGLLPKFPPESVRMRKSFHMQPWNSSLELEKKLFKVRCIIKGRVQGVFYRNWTIENANQLGLKGWVRNRRDGSVEALFSGKAEVVDEMVQRCRRGPPDAMVTALNVDPSNEDPGSGFERKPTV